MASLSNGGGQQKSPSSGERRQQQQERLVYSTRRIITTSTRREITKSQSSKELLEEKSSLRPQQKQQEGLVSDSSTTFSAGKVDDSICVLEQQWQQRQPTKAIMSPAKRAHKQAKLASHNEPLEQQEKQQVKQSQSQFENNNHNNGNNDCNNGKVRLLISPATDYYGSKQHRQQQQMVHSAMIGDDEAILQQQQQQQQQLQQPRTRSQAGRQFRQQKNYHHYDYYTDSDLASTAAANQSQQQQQYAAYLNQTKPMVNHYDDNILLFATEHNNNNTKPPPANVGHQQQVYLATNDGSRSGSSSRSNQNQANNNNDYYFHQLPEVAAANRAQLSLNKAGRFVNYYPSWRQTQSPTTSHSYQNYSFHVPTSPSTARLAAYRGQQHQRPDSRAGRSFNSSLRSQTIAHIPNMVKQLANNSPSDNNRRARNGNSNGDQTGDEQTNSSPITYEDFYERPSQVGISLTDQRSRGISEGDLLKVHLVHLNHGHRPSYHHVDEGFDNPFKPGTELSWEADMMVRLMKRGYPVQELPVLVETAKQVAREKSSPTVAAATVAPAIVTDAYSLASKHGGYSTAKDDLKVSSTRVRGVEGMHPFSSKQAQALIRRKSSADLSPGKQIWANSLIRAKSMPRFYARPQAATSSADSDSIDKLITSIENEMTDLLRFEQEGDNQEDEETETAKRLKSASLSRIEGQNSNSNKAQAKRVQKSTKTIPKVPTTKTANNNNKSKKLDDSKRGVKVSTESDDNNQRVLQEVTNRKRPAVSGGQNLPGVVGLKKEKKNTRKKAQDLKEVEKKRETACCVIQ